MFLKVMGAIFSCGLICMNGVKRLLWWLLSGSAGCFKRGRILRELFTQPRNANELAKILDLRYGFSRS